MGSYLRQIGWISCLALAAASLLAPSAQAGTRAGGVSCGNGTLVNSPSVGTFDNLYGIAAVNPQDVWAVGRYIEGSTSSRALVEHWNGRYWLVVNVPQPTAHIVYLNAVTAVSATDVWAVGFTANSRDGDQRTLTEHWNGSAWSIVPSPADGVLNAVTAFSAGDVWAVGDTFHGSGRARTLAEHWDGTRWSVVASPSPGRFDDVLKGVTVAGPDSLWAVGSTGTSQYDTFVALTEHWNGTTWSVVRAPQPGVDSEFRSVTSAGASDVWAVGFYYVQTPTGTASYSLAEHWNGTRWSQVAIPSPTGDDIYEGVSAASAGDIWAVGSQSGDPDLIARWNGRQWVQVVNPPYRHGGLNSLFGVSAPSPTDVWAAGGFISLRDYSYQTLTENLCPAG